MEQALSNQKIWWLEYRHTYTGEHAYICYGRAVRLSDGKSMDWDGNGSDVLEQILDFFTNQGAVYVFVWDIDLFGAFLEYNVLKNGFPHFDDVEKVKGSTRPKEPCYSCLYAGGHGMLNFRITLRRTRYTAAYRGGRIGGLHTVEYRGMAPYFQNEPRQDINKAAGLEEDDFTAEGGRTILYAFAKEFERLTGEPVFTYEFMRRVYTIGGAAKRKYLKIRYGKASMAAYHKEHPQDEGQEDYFRARKLLLPGLISFSPTSAGMLVDRPLRKYDVNGLYSFTANNVGELGTPEECSFREFVHGDPEYEFIIILSELRGWQKKDKCAAFLNPFTRERTRIPELQEGQEIALFRPLWYELRQYYFFDSFKILRCLKLKKKQDPAIIKYNAFFQDEKRLADEEKNGVRRMLAKLFLNIILGKMSQSSKFFEVVARLDEKTDTVNLDRGKLVNKWEKSHFDYIRGAYIYQMARVKVLQDIRAYIGPDVSAHHFYTDTDSIVTDIEFPADAISKTETGKYKIEEEYTAFSVLGAKQYYGRTKEGEDKITAAGIPRGNAIKILKDKYGDLTPSEIVQKLKDDETKFPVPFNHRCPGGAFRDVLNVSLKSINVDRMLII